MKKKLVELIRNLRPEGKRDLYGLCSPMKESGNTFEYGIGVLVADYEKINTTYSWRVYCVMIRQEVKTS